MDYYNAMLADHQNQAVEQEIRADGKVQTISGTGEAEIESAVLLNDAGLPLEVVNVGDDITLKIIARVNADLPELVLGYLIKDRLGQPVYGTNTYHLGQPIQQIKAGERVTYQFTFAANMGEGSYSVTLALHASDSHIAANYVWKDRAILFTVVNINQPHFSGVAWLPSKLELVRG